MLVKSILKAGKLDIRLDILEIKQCLVVNGRGKAAPVVENNSGSW